MPLEDCEETLELCFRCSRCKWICDWDIKNAEFAYICPSLKKYLFDAYSAQGRMDIARALLRGELDYSDKLLEIIYTCTLCGGCEITCKRNHAKMEPLKVLHELRFKCVSDGKGPMEQHKKFAENIEKFHNPYGEPHEARFEWMPKGGKDSRDAEVGLFIGCTIPYRLPEVARSAAGVLETLNIKFRVFPEDELCCGGVLYRVGLASKTRELMEHNLKMIEAAGIKRLLFACPGCYETFKSIYPKLGGKLNFEAQHMVEFLSELLDNDKIRFDESHQQVTYHDPCHLGRLMGVYEQPRRILKAIPGLKLVEMDRKMDNSWCCGAGGGVKAAFQDFAMWAARERLEEAKTINSELLLTACPFCELNLKDSAEECGKYPQVKDILELVYEKIKS
ncbi:MAG: (Fe-S)-binding protein [Candidatus Jordarchaeum sp.]|uniref:(Fe-S)-binding protein n=1 Tax=Candidatus Jordarchaeum sp. TaxID=2823881 RepID=UPI00404B5FC0